MDRLYPYLDHELTPEEIETVRGHLAECAACADHFTFEERFLRKLHDAYADDRAPERLRRAIVLRLREH